VEYLSAKSDPARGRLRQDRRETFESITMAKVANADV